MNPKEFFDKVTEMREAQKEYFRTRNGATLAKSKALEKEIDNEIARAKAIIEKCATTNGNAAGGIVDRKEYETPPQSPQTPNRGNKTGGSDFDRWQMNDIRYRMHHNGKGIAPICFVPGINGEMMNIQPFDEEMFRRRVSSDVRVMMEKFTPDCNIEWKGNIDMCVRVVYKQINLCDFDVA